MSYYSFKKKKEKSFEETSKDPFWKKFYSRLRFNKSKAELKRDLLSSLELPIYTFTKYPWALWITGITIFPFNILTTYVLYIFYSNTLYNNFVLLLNIGFYYLDFYLFYIGEIEKLDINRKKGFVVKKKINIFLSKREYLFKFDNVDYIEIVMKGFKQGAYDYRKYFIRIYNKEKSIRPIEFGSTLDFEKAKLKYQICLAMIKGMIETKVKDYLVKDESEYLDFIY